MSTWCLAHPWMTFFIALSATGTIRYVAYVMATALRRKRTR